MEMTGRQDEGVEYHTWAARVYKPIISIYFYIDLFY